MADVTALLAEVVSSEHVLAGDEISDDYGHDEALTAAAGDAGVRGAPRRPPPRSPASCAWPTSTAIPVTARGNGTGLSGAAVPRPDGIVVSFERMNEVLEIDDENHVAVVQPGVTLDQLDEVTAGARARLPRLPGRVQRQPRRQRRHQRRRHARGEVRRHPPPGARPRGGARDRRGHPHRRQVRQGDAPATT